MQSFHEARRTTLKLATQFMGLDSDEDEDAVEIDDVDGVEQRVRFPRSTQRRLWHNRRVRLAKRRYGGIKEEFLFPENTTPAGDENLGGGGGGSGGGSGGRVERDTVDHHSPDDVPMVLIPVGPKPSVGHYLKKGIIKVKNRLSRRPEVTDSSGIHHTLEEISCTTSSLSPSAQPQTSVASAGDGSDEVFFDINAKRLDTVDNRLALQDSEQTGRIPRNVLANLNDNSNRRQKYGVGRGIVGKLLSGQVIKSRQRAVRHQLDELEDYRPNFTYWITTVQTVVLVISLAWYGFAPFGTGVARSEGLVMSGSLTLDQVAFLEPANFWGGPRPADLIHLGAKYSPCMRYDLTIHALVKERRKLEAEESGCCVRRDGSGCMQTTKGKCSPLLSNFNKAGYYDHLVPTTGPNGELSGPVCGQDPRYCASPASAPPNEWSYDITQWPICRRQNSSSISGAPEHVTCKLTARPCCIGIHGRCEIVSQDYCQFVKGHFHREATLCSQVDCMGDVCGMLSFATKDSPDQVYRLWTPLFLHAGLIHLSITWLIHWYLMRDLERLCGPIRMAIIYIGSGVMGNAASAVFVPHRAESGPAGSQYGLLAGLLVEVINSWPMLKHPYMATLKLAGVLFVLLLAGLLPWIDNYAHVFGFLGGALLAFCFLPYLTFPRMPGQPSQSYCSAIMYTKRGRAHVMAAAATGYTTILVGLLAIFYGAPDLACEYCKYLSCLPFTDTFCAEQNIDMERSQTSLL